MTTLADRIRAGLPNGVRETFDPGGSWGYPVFNTVQDMARHLVEYLANTIPEFDAIASAMFLRVLPEFATGGSMVLYAKHFMNDNMDSAAENILEFIATDIEDNFRETTMEDTNDTILPTFPDTLDAAKRRAAIAIFKCIEAAAAKGIEGVSSLYDLATAFKNASDSLPREPDSTVTNLRNELQAANDEVSEVRGKLAAMTTSRAVLFSELSAIDALLSYAKTWTTYTAPIITHSQRKDVIKSLAERAEVLSGVQGELAKTELDKRNHPANAVATLIMQRNEARVALVVKQDHAQLAAVIGEVVDLMNFWRRGNDAYHKAAGTLETSLKTALGDAYQPLVDRARVHRDADTTSRPDDAKDDAVDLASAPFPMNEGHTTLQDAIDEATARAKANKLEADVTGATQRMNASRMGQF